jgi:hypothetical protein
MKNRDLMPGTARALALKCPQCEAPPGMYCRTPSGSKIASVAHYARRELAAEQFREAAK